MMGETILQISVTALISILVMFVEHWFPWGVAFRAPLPRIPCYTLGTAAIVLPLAGLFWFWIDHAPAWPWAYVAALISVTVCGGLAVITAYGIDRILARLARSDELQEIVDKRDERRSS